MEKLVVVIMGQDCEKFIPMCLESVKDADAIIFCDGGSTDSTLQKCKGFIPGLDEHSRHSNVNLKEHSKYIISHTYDQEDKTMNGKQRNYYLNFIKKNFKDYWCLVLDADEVVDTDGIKKLKEFINFLPKENNDILFSPKMRHLIGDLAHEDSTQPVHFVPHRLFKIRDELSYPEVEHPVIGHEGEVRMQNLIITTIWHLAYTPGLWDIKKRYECHKKKSQMHTPEYLEEWRDAHLLGLYPRNQFDIQELPKVILDEFKINKEKWYFRTRKLENKHWLDVYQWKEYFKLGDKNVKR